MFSQALPIYSGPYSVGSIDLEVPVPKQSYGTGLLKGTNQPALLIETILLTLYYPCNTPTGSGKQHMPWLERPLSRTARGYAKLASKPSWLVWAALVIVGRKARLPAFVDATLARSVSSQIDGKTDGQESSSSTSSNITEEEKSKPWPTLIFSHGLSGTRTTYSQFCGEMASRGYVVAAIEHRDGSGPITVVKQEDGKEREVLYLNVDQDLEFLPPHEKLSSTEFRGEQLDMRLGEVEHAVRVLNELNDGKGDELYRLNKRREGKSLHGFKGRLDMHDGLYMTGHSFGGATTLQVLRAGKERFRFSRGATLDPWVDPIPPVVNLMRRTSTSASRHSSSRPARDDAQSVGTDIVDPLLVINSEAFTLWTEHFKQVRAIVKAVKNDAESWLLTLVGSIHISFSDVPIVVPSLTKRYGGARVDPLEAVLSFVETTDEFLSGNGQSGKVLGRQVLDGDEDNKRPGEPPMESPGELRLHIRPKARL